MRPSPSAVPTVPTQPTDVQQAVYFLRKGYSKIYPDIKFEPAAALARGVVALFMSLNGSYWCDVLIKTSIVKPEKGVRLYDVKGSVLEQLGFACFKTNVGAKQPDYRRAQVAAFNMLQEGDIEWFTEYKIIPYVDCSTYFKLLKERRAMTVTEICYFSRDDLVSFLKLHKEHLSLLSCWTIRLAFELHSTKGRLEVDKIDKVFPAQWEKSFKCYLERENS